MKDEKLKKLEKKEVENLDKLLKFLAKNRKQHQTRNLPKTMTKDQLNFCLNILRNDGFLSSKNKTLNIQIGNEGVAYHHRGGYIKDWKQLQSQQQIQNIEQTTNIQRNKAIILTSAIAVFTLLLTIRTEYLNHINQKERSQMQQEINHLKHQLKSYTEDTTDSLNTSDEYLTPPLHKKDTNQ